MSQDGWENYRIGCKLLERITRPTLRLYCNVDHGPDRIPAGMVRLSCGLESAEDLIADLSQALDAI